MLVRVFFYQQYHQEQKQLSVVLSNLKSLGPTAVQRVFPETTYLVLICYCCVTAAYLQLKGVRSLKIIFTQYFF